MISLYQSGWSPAGIRKDWERCSLGKDSAKAALGQFHDRMGAEVKEAVCWLDDNGCLRRMVVDYENGRRVDMSQRANGTNVIRFGRVPC